MPNGSVWLLEKVQHISDLRRNLIYVGQLDDERHAILFVGGTWKVTRGARVLACGKKTGTLYMTSSPRNTIVVAKASTDTSLWRVFSIYFFFHRFGNFGLISYNTFWVVRKVFAANEVDVHEITSEHQVRASEPRTLKFESAPIML